MKKYAIVAIGILAVGFVLLLKSRHKVVDPLLTPIVEVQAAAEPSRPTHPVPSIAASPVVSTQTNAAPPAKTIIQRLIGQDTNVFKLSAEQVQAFLAKNGTNAESLLAAFNVTSDKEYLREALRRFPDSSLVLTSALANDALPDQRRELIERLKQISPDNPLANYLAARDHLKSQQQDLALKEFMDASSKSGFQDFSVERIQGLEDMYLSAGYSAAEAKALAMTSLKVPSIAQLRELGRDMSKLERQYVAAGDSASAEMLAKMGLTLAADISRGNANSLLSQMVGSVVAREFLSGLDPNASYDFLTQPVNERLAQLQAQNKSIRESAKFFDKWVQSANDAQLVGYFDRLKLYGEASAMNWAKGQFSEASPVP